MDQVYLAVQQLGELHLVLQGQAALDDLRAAHADLDGEIRAALLPDVFDDLQGDPGPVLQAPAVFVRAAVVQRGEELMQEPAVSGVDHDHVDPAQLGHLRGISEAVYHVVDDLLRHLHIVLPQMAGAVAGPPDGAVIILWVGAGPRVDQLHGGEGVVFLDGVGGRVEIGKHLGVVQGDAQLMGDARLQVDAALPQVDNGGAAPGLALKDGDVFRRGIAVLGQVGDVHRGGLDPVLQRIGADLDGAEQMGIGFHVMLLFSKRWVRAGQGSRHAPGWNVDQATGFFCVIRLTTT